MSDNKETKQAPAVEAGAQDERAACEAAFEESDWSKRTSNKVAFREGWQARAALISAKDSSPTNWRARLIRELDCPEDLSDESIIERVGELVQHRRAALARASESAAGTTARTA